MNTQEPKIWIQSYDLKLQRQRYKNLQRKK
jgi:hypothetical protein